MFESPRSLCSLNKLQPQPHNFLIFTILVPLVNFYKIEDSNLKKDGATCAFLVCRPLPFMCVAFIRKHVLTSELNLKP